MTKLRVRLFAGLRERAGSGELLTDWSEGMTLGSLKARLEASHPELGSLGFVRGVIGTEYAPDERAVGPQDEVSLLPPVSGGAPGVEFGVFEIHSEPLDVAAAQARVAHESCGAVVTFTGMTRATNRGQQVARLDYEAFEAMAASEMARIFRECRESFDSETDPERALRLYCAHRTGTVGVGEPSVVIAAASPHRELAFGAARFLIDELKRSVPLWKKECYADGHHWIGDRS